MSLYDTMVDAIFPPRDTEVTVRKLTHDHLTNSFSPQWNSLRTDSVASLFRYSNSDVQACILEAKFHANDHATQLLGRALGEFLYEYIAESLPFYGMSSKNIVLLPIPLSPLRLKERGYNQTERIARYAHKYLKERSELYIGMSTDTLVRTRNTLPQTSLSGIERRKNIEGAFTAGEKCENSSLYIVLDDVYTTGSTMRAALDALQAGGA